MIRCEGFVSKSVLMDLIRMIQMGKKTKYLEIYLQGIPTPSENESDQKSDLEWIMC